ncbi:hypothetical protein AAG906_006548 [Vitis piasezkii]
MEEQQERRNDGEKEGGQPSRNSGQSGPEPREHRIDIVEISPRGTQDIKKFYEPRVISFGPYHHGKSHLHPGEMIKPPCAQNFLADSNQDIDGTQKSKVISRHTEDDSTVDLSNVLRIHQINFVVRDLFLPENQLPFGVLKLIFEEAKFKGGSIMQEKKEKVARWVDIKK